MSNDLIVSDFMPAMTIEDAIARRNAIVEFVNKAMVKGVDFGVIPGTDKPTLLKPGAEKLCTLFRLAPKFVLVDSEKDWTGKEHGEPFFYFSYKCELRFSDQLISEGDGSCNSWEKKYRWRNQDRVCPNCGKPNIRKSKQGDGWYCWAKTGGCGNTFAPNDAAIVSQPTGQIANPDIADIVNTLQKMAQKRALIAATLIAINASEFFTQDIEDMVIDGQATVSEKTEQPIQAKSQPTPSAQRPPAHNVKIKTGKWADAVKELGAMTYYQAKDGTPDTYHMLGSAAKIGIAEINDANVVAVKAQLIAHAQASAAMTATESTEIP